ncbi:MAG TPA: glycogen debranching N-terminal domain-containing protein, partial [Thermomicrobiales bacterium]|nr:glycogen debranching N-terminal domain-containing protein [Thermomicrobiales bacterium]
MLDCNLVLKNDELFLVGDISTDGSGERATGLYLRDTRHLSRFRVTLNEVRPDQLSARTHGATTATVTTTNPQLRLADGKLLRPHLVLLEQQVRLGTGLQVTFVLQNFSTESLSLTLGLELGADFRDLFDIRGFPFHPRGRCLPPRLEERTIILGYRGLDDAVVETAIAFDRAASVRLRRLTEERTDEPVALLPGFDAIALEPAPEGQPGALATFAVSLAPGDRWELRTVATPRPVGEPVTSAVSTGDGHEPRNRATVTTDNPFFDRVLARSDRDLAALMTRFPEGTLPAAGIPWYVAPFGRDALIVGLQTLHLQPALAAGTLRVLAALQGAKIDETREEEPGKILHEMRYGEMARRHEIPHTPYYGTVDATPLFIWLFAETVAWTGDARLYRELLPNVRRALDWIERYGDKDGNGLVEYRTDAHGVARITHQVWKDSFDSLHYPDGRPAAGLITAVEVQGYVYAAYARLAEIVAASGDESWASNLRDKAEAVRRKVEEEFWLEDLGFYAQALGDDKLPVAAISSNPGHLLLCGLPSSERAARVAARLCQPDLDSGWGIRTLSSAVASYNPMSYHNGSVWPHDNSLIAAGLYRYGHAAAAGQIARALFAAAQTYPQERLPELYCGFARQEATDDAPVAYPVSCSPQAWAVA